MHPLAHISMSDTLRSITISLMQWSHRTSMVSHPSSNTASWHRVVTFLGVGLPGRSCSRVTE